MANALLVIDIQNDLFSGGQFRIPESESILQSTNNYISRFNSLHLPVIFSRDWHPSITHHFDQYGGKWPMHCIANSWGAQFHSDLLLPPNATIISKGTKSEEDSYSAFQGTDNLGRSLEIILNELEIKSLSICGLLTDYCVKYSTLHALEKGFKIYLLIDAIKGLNLLPSDSIRAIDEMAKNGADLITFDSFQLL